MAIPVRTTLRGRTVCVWTPVENTTDGNRTKNDFAMKNRECEQSQGNGLILGNRHNATIFRDRARKSVQSFVSILRKLIESILRPEIPSLTSASLFIHTRRTSRVSIRQSDPLMIYVIYVMTLTVSSTNRPCSVILFHKITRLPCITSPMTKFYESYRLVRAMDIIPHFVCRLRRLY